MPWIRSREGRAWRVHENLESDCGLPVHFNHLQSARCASERFGSIPYASVESLDPWKHIEVLIRNIVQSTTKRITVYYKYERCPPHLSSAQAGKLVRNGAFGRDSTSFGAPLGSDCQYWKRFRSGSAFSCFWVTGHLERKVARAPSDQRPKLGLGRG